MSKDRSGPESSAPSYRRGVRRRSDKAWIRRSKPREAKLIQIFIKIERSSDELMARSFFDRLSLESFDKSDTRGKAYFASKSQKSLSKGKESSHHRRSRRLENRSIAKERTKREKFKTKGKRPEYQETRNKDPEDHLSIFSAATEQEEWLMPIWCKMFRQTLGGAAQNSFDDLDPQSVNSFEELSQKFLQEFSQQKRYAKDPTEIHGIKRRQNEGLQTFMDRFKSKSSQIKSVPPVLCILAFLHGHGHPKLAKKLNDKMPNTGDEMFERVGAFIRGEATVGSEKMARPPQWDKGNTCSVWSVGQDKTINKNGPREEQKILLARNNPGRRLGKESMLPKKERDEEKKCSFSASAKLAWAKPEKYFGKFDMPKDMKDRFEKLSSSSLHHSLNDKVPYGQQNHNDDEEKRNLSGVPEEEEAQGLTPMDMIGIPCFIAEHELKPYPHIEPKVQRKRSTTPDRRNVVKEEVAEWLKAGIVKWVRCPSWVANPVLVKKSDNS
nr:reverse transcriptase domain-containing protein [Tanacetum cinerariifolium]